MQQIYDTSTLEGKQKAIDGYRQGVTQNPGLSFKAFCDQSGISDYKQLLWWCNDHGIRIYDIQRRKDIHYSLKRLKARKKITEIMYILFGIHTANVVQLAGRIAEQQLAAAA